MIRFIKRHLKYKMFSYLNLPEIQIFETQTFPSFQSMENDQFFNINMHDEYYSSDEESVFEDLKKPLKRGFSSPTTHSSADSNKEIETFQSDINALDSDDLNKEVERIINSKPIESLLEEGILIDDNVIAELSVNKRRRKTKEQIKLLMEEYSRFQNWDKQDMDEIAGRLHMSFAQVYKWHWDQKKKSEKKAKPSKKASL